MRFWFLRNEKQLQNTNHPNSSGFPFPSEKQVIDVIPFPFKWAMIAGKYLPTIPGSWASEPIETGT